MTERPVIDAPERFFSKFVENSAGCWVWAACAQPYPILQWKGKKRYAHRLAWEWANGEIPPGHHVHHRCGQPLCVNPEHLEVHSPEDHVDAHGGSLGGALTNAAKTHCKRGHEFSPENTYVWEKQPTQRKCRTCRNARARALRRKVAA